MSIVIKIINNRAQHSESLIITLHTVMVHLPLNKYIAIIRVSNSMTTKKLKEMKVASRQIKIMDVIMSVSTINYTLRICRLKQQIPERDSTGLVGHPVMSSCVLLKRIYTLRTENINRECRQDQSS